MHAVGLALYGVYFFAVFGVRFWTSVLVDLLVDRGEWMGEGETVSPVRTEDPSLDPREPG